MKSHGAYSAREAKTYNADRETEPLWYIENAHVSELLQRTQATSILDAPIGTGRFLNLYKSAQITGVDISSAMLVEASRRAEKESVPITLQQASITKLPYADGQFDLVICWRLLHLLPPEELDYVFSELRRVCRGVLCVQCYVPAYWWERQIAKTKRRVRRLWRFATGSGKLSPWSHIRAWSHTLEAISASAARNGFGPASRCELLGVYEGTHVLAVEWDVTR